MNRRFSIEKKKKNVAHLQQEAQDFLMPKKDDVFLTPLFVSE